MFQRACVDVREVFVRANQIRFAVNPVRCVIRIIGGLPDNLYKTPVPVKYRRVS